MEDVRKTARAVYQNRYTARAVLQTSANNAGEIFIKGNQYFFTIAANPS